MRLDLKLIEVACVRDRPGARVGMEREQLFTAHLPWSHFQAA